MSAETPAAADDASLRRDIADIRHYYFDPSLPPDGIGGDTGDGLVGLEGSSGGYVTISGPVAAPVEGLPAPSSSWLPRMEFGMAWRPEIGAPDDNGHLQLGRSLTSGADERIGLRADITALLSQTGPGGDETMWRVTGMLGSTSLSLVSEDDRAPEEAPGNGGLLWDIGVGWSSGAVSLNAGYQAVRSLDGTEEAASSILSFGADYSLLPNLMVYGQFNLFDGPTAEDGASGTGTAVILGTGVKF